MQQRIGYARVSTEDQKLDLQMQALERAGCDTIFRDHGVSGKTFDREGLGAALTALKTGDTLVVWRLDRLGRSLSELIRLMEDLGAKHVGFSSLTEGIDTTSSGGRLVFHMLAALAEFERSLISERTIAGMQAARRRGKHLGRRPSLNGEQVDAAILAIEQRGEAPKHVAERMGVSDRNLKNLIMARRKRTLESLVS